MTRDQKNKLLGTREKREVVSVSNDGGGVNKVANRKVAKSEKNIKNQRNNLDALNPKRIV